MLVCSVQYTAGNCYIGVLILISEDLKKMSCG